MMMLESGESLVCEECGINLENEKSLHAAVKSWYCVPGDRLEARVDGSIADILRGDLIIEIQTANFGSIRGKLGKLVKNHKVRLVYPVAKEKIIIRTDASGNNVISRRRSNKRGKVVDLFGELVRIPDLINEDNFTIEVLLIKVEEIRCEDGKGSWRRKGQSIVDRKLVEIYERVEFKSKEDFLRILPEGLCSPFSNNDLAAASGYSIHDARKITYCLKKMDAIKAVGKKGNSIMYEV